jgi:hypothetical protein
VWVLLVRKPSSGLDFVVGERKASGCIWWGKMEEGATGSGIVAIY